MSLGLQKFQSKVLIIKSVTSSLNLVSILSIINFLELNLSSKILYTNFPKDQETDWFKGYGFVHLSNQPDPTKKIKNRIIEIPSIQSIPIVYPNLSLKYHKPSDVVQRELSTHLNLNDQLDFNSSLNCISKLSDLIPNRNTQTSENVSSDTSFNRDSHFRNDNNNHKTHLQILIESCNRKNQSGIESCQTMDQVTIRRQNQFKNNLKLRDQLNSALQDFGGFHGSLKHKKK
ncbi:expressed protein [Phakopsora pachyrhizi]|uniref:Expressed protein n=1 Tax=Phakopsora pachyrhizi TaxID=170000 RepID=A0AAV0AQ08_PHAPC|nr:expressed protein [Phakopsora pachyrhizi]